MKSSDMIRTTVALLALSTPLLAEDLTLPLDAGVKAETITSRYSCNGGAPFEVRYINAGENSLALVPVAGASRIFVSTVSASGARYVSGALEWWSKGDDATLIDTMDEAATQQCVAAPA